MAEPCKQCPDDTTELSRYFHLIWDVEEARKIVAEESAAFGYVTREQLLKLGLPLEPERNTFNISFYVCEEHLTHIPTDKIDEPLILAPYFLREPAPLNTLIDGRHRATCKLRAGADRVKAYLLSVEQSRHCCVDGWDLFTPFSDVIDINQFASTRARRRQASTVAVKERR